MQLHKDLKQRALTYVTLAVFVTTMLFTPAIAGAQNAPAARSSHGALSVPISGQVTLPDAGGVSAFSGNFTIQRFIAQDGKLVALGTLVGQTASGRDIVVHGVQAPVTDIRSIGSETAANTTAGLQAVQATCPILHLAIGAINLNVLGLVVTTNPIVIDIAAQPGPGNLLGNLLCAVANLLNNGGPLANILNQLVGLLNQILGQLRAIA